LKFPEAEIFRLIVACCSKKTVGLAWGKRISQRYGGKAASRPGKNIEEVIFEVPYHPLGFVSPVHV
jgi:hypothetical protein